MYPIQHNLEHAVYSEVLNWHWVWLDLVPAAGMCAPFPVAGLTFDQCIEWTVCVHTAVSHYSSSVWQRVTSLAVVVRQFVQHGFQLA